MLRIFAILFIFPVFNELKGQNLSSEKCGPLTIDILDGKVNKARPDYAPDRIKLELPCFTRSTDESDSARCGGTIEYKDKEICFFTALDYVEIGAGFKGAWTIPVMGAKKGSLFNYLGNPKNKGSNWEAFQTAYGTLLLYFDDAGKVRLVRMSTKTTDLLNFCE